jgi:hypothetical protein
MQWIGAVGPWLQQQEEQQVGLRKKIGVFLCSTKEGSRRVGEYILQHQLRAGVWYIGHTSMDLALDMGTFDNSSSSGGGYGGGKVDQMLHVASTEGEDPRKVTNQLLSCWKDAAGAAGVLPPLTAVVPLRWRAAQDWAFDGVPGLTFVPEVSD